MRYVLIIAADDRRCCCAIDTIILPIAVSLPPLSMICRCFIFAALFRRYASAPYFRCHALQLRIYVVADA